MKPPDSDRPNPEEPPLPEPVDLIAWRFSHRPVNRLASPLPDSVLDRYFAEHPDEHDFRKD